jgi:small subunit ribosomal protein S5
MKGLFFMEDVFIEKVVFINRVTKVTKGGKNLNFSALVVVGNQKGKIGFSQGKAAEVAEAIRKGIKRARKHLTEIPLKSTTIPHEVYGKFGAVEVMLKPALRGTGVIASSAVRAVCECAGIHDILTKVLRKSNNPINVVRATFEGLTRLKAPEIVQDAVTEPKTNP